MNLVPSHTCSGTERHRLEDIGRAPHTTIDKQLEFGVGEGDAALLFEFLHDFHQHFETRTREVELPSTMVRQDHSREALIICFQGVLIAYSLQRTGPMAARGIPYLPALNTLEDKRH